MTPESAEERRRLLKLLLAEEGIEVERDSAIPRRLAGAEAPLSFAQRRLWFINRLEPKSPLYNIPGAVRLSGPLSRPALEAALREIQCRHEVLRTTFTLPNGEEEPVQVVSPDADLSLPCVDLQGLPDPQGEASRLAGEERRRPFDLRHGPLLRVTLLRLEEREWLLLFTLHHIVADGWSIGILLREMGDGYRSHLAGRPPRWPELPIQYADFAVWQRQRLQGQVLEELLHVWRRRLAGASMVMALPFDRPRGVSSPGRSGEESFLLPAEPVQGLCSLGRREGATLFMVLLAGFSVALWHFTGQEDMILGSNVANRDRWETQGLIGFFVNLLPLRVELARAATFRDLLTRVRDMTSDVYSQQDVSFDLLVRELRIERTATAPPLVQVMIDFQDVPAAPLDLPGVEVRSFGSFGEVAPKLALDLSLTHREQGLRCALRYSFELFYPSTITRLLDGFRLCLTWASEDPDRPLPELKERLSRYERQQDLATRDNFKKLRSNRLRQASPRYGQPASGGDPRPGMPDEP